MIVSFLHTSEMPIIILSESFGDVEVLCLNNPFKTIRARDTRRVSAETQPLFNASCFLRNSAFIQTPDLRDALSFLSFFYLGSAVP